jgi:trehalose/maltose hydrolase-like predicted phosphorylase
VGRIEQSPVIGVPEHQLSNTVLTHHKLRELLDQLCDEADEGSTWVLVVPDGPAESVPVHESWLALADGSFGTRGSLEEGGAGSAPAVYVAGVYDRAPDGGERLLEVPTWTQLAMRAPEPGDRVLDLRTGVVLRRAPGARGPFRSARWVCLARPGTGVLVAEGSDLVPVPTPARVATAVRSSLDGVVAGLVDTVGVSQGRGEAPTSLARITSMTDELERAPWSYLASRQEEAWRIGPVALLDEQRNAWSQRWRESDVEITGNDELTRAARFAMFHVMASAADQVEAAVGPHGLTGPGYGGHVFWDADVFVLPVLAATHPTAARAIVEYRIRRLPAARRAAAASGHAGVRFPWESGLDGSDVTPKSGPDGHGGIMPIHTGELEEHITADVAWAAWQLSSWTGSWHLLGRRGRPLLLETARYWASRIRLDDAGRGHIDHVIGPDEYHEDVNDDVFTNRMAQWNLERAAELVLRRGDAEDPAEAARWRDLAHQLVSGYDGRAGRHVQFDGYDRLEPLRVEGLTQTAPMVLGSAGVAASQIVKQADVLMAHHLVPETMPEGSLEADLDYYVPRTDHGSALSHGIHAAVLARAGRLTEACAHLEAAADIDLGGVGSMAADGVQLGAMASVWHALVLGFAGVRATSPDQRALVLDPHIPPDWGELRIQLRWHGRPVALRCRSDAVHVACLTPLRVQLGGGPPVRVAPPGRWVERKAP